MQVLNLIQGSPEWHAARNDPTVVGTASEASAMMGQSKHMTRDELVRIKATGIKPEVDSYKQKIFDAGHAAEAKARPLVEEKMGEELYPATCIAIIEGIKLLASPDGLTMDEAAIWENKQFNPALAEQVEANNLDPHYYLQLEHQLLVTNARVAYFTTSDGTPENTRICTYRSVPARREQLIEGWKQFAKDVAAYQHVEVIPQAVGAAVAKLPALVVQLVGNVVSSNLAVYEGKALELIKSINTDLQTDQDFADAETMVKFCDSAEKELDLVKTQALGQTATIDELFRTIDGLKAAMAAKRISLEKLVKARKDAIKTEVVSEAVAGLIAHCNQLDRDLGRKLMPTIAADFQTAIKGKRTVSTLRSSANAELARAKVEANVVFKRIAANIALPEVNEYPFLFNDLAAICTKPAEDFAAAVRLRVGDHIAAEEARLEKEREAIRAEELAKIAAETLAAESASKVAVPLVEPEPAAITLIVQDEAHSVPASANLSHLASAVIGQAGPARVTFSAQPGRPSDIQIVDALCRVYGATRPTIVHWLSEMNLQALKQAA